MIIASSSYQIPMKHTVLIDFNALEEAYMKTYVKMSDQRGQWTLNQRSH